VTGLGRPARAFAHWNRPATPALSVALSVYNGAAYLGAAIESILAQSFTDFEFLILDDGSRDDSRAVAESYAARDRRIRVIARENRGLVASLNQLLVEARAPLVARMDADDICPPHRFAAQLAFLADHPAYGMVGADCSYIDAAGQPIAGRQIPRPLSHEAIVANLECGPTMLHNVVIYRRQLVLDLGGYRPAFVHAEDYDLWLRMSRATRMENLPEPLVAYRLYPDQVSNRHCITQARSAAQAWLSHQACLAGLPDPAAGLDQLPPDAALDATFGPGARAFVHRRVVERSLYAPGALAAEGWPMLLEHARANGRDRRLWRLAGRMAKAGLPAHAGRLGMKLALG
jgi:hypothetical protein